MVERQLRRRGIGDERVLAAMGGVPRERSSRSGHRRRAYADSALPIGEEQTISQPWIVAAICQALELSGDERVLEVGTGSGYSAAVLALLAAEVVGIERHESLAARPAERSPRSASSTSSCWSATAAAACRSGRRSTRSPSTPPRRRHRRTLLESARRRRPPGRPDRRRGGRSAHRLPPHGRRAASGRSAPAASCP